jgi:hypothetical protein
LHCQNTSRSFARGIAEGQINVLGQGILDSYNSYIDSNYTTCDPSYWLISSVTIDPSYNAQQQETKDALSVNGGH